MSMPQQKKVVHLTTVHHPYDPRIYHKECKSLQRAGFDVTLIAQPAASQQRQAERRELVQHGNTTTGSPPEPEIHHLPIQKHTSRMKRMLFGSLELYQKAKAEKADVYHFHDPELLPVGWLLKKSGNTVIYDIHEDYVTSMMQKEYMAYPIRKLAGFLYKQLEKFFTKDMELCLAEKYYQEMYPDGVLVLNYPTVNEKFIRRSREEAPIENKLLYTGNVSEVRGAQIHAKLPVIDERVSVHFVGKCPGALAEEMKQIAGDGADRLHFEGIDRFVEKEVIEQRYLERNWLAGIALFPPTAHYMKKELTKFFEYMNAGLPIICSDFPVWKNFIDTYQCGLAVDPYDEHAIHQAMAYLRNNPERAREMGRNGKKAVTEELNWHSQEEILITWYNQLLGTQSANTAQKGLTD